MKHWLILFALCSLFLQGVAWSQPVPWENNILYITQYQTALDATPVYGVFDLGLKPSLRIMYPSAKPGEITFLVHGKHYHTPVAGAFKVSLAFEDATGRIFQNSQPYSFKPEDKSIAPQWFSQLDQIVGYYGDEMIQAKVPAGTTVIDILGNAEKSPATPNTLVGYVSHIQISSTP